MKMRKIALSALIACALAMGSFGAAFADAQSASWDVAFTSNKQMESNYDQDKINAEIRQMQPGDNLTLDVSIKNDSAEATQWYMTSSVLKTLEDANETMGGAYAYALSYDGNEIFSSESVGGDNMNGLQEVEDATGSWFHLANLEPGQGGNVQLYMALDGMTQENVYQNRLGGLQINFAVEDAPQSSVQPNRLYVGNQLEQTGDLWMDVVMFAVCIVLIALTIMSFSRDRMKAKAVPAYGEAMASPSATNEDIRKGGDE